VAFRPPSSPNVSLFPAFFKTPPLPDPLRNSEDGRWQLCQFSCSDADFDAFSRRVVDNSVAPAVFLLGLALKRQGDLP